MTPLPPEPPEDWPASKSWPPGVQSLDDAFDKLRWAKKHFEVLREKIEPFEQRDTHSISCQPDPEAGKYTFFVHDLEQPASDDWGLMIGDCLHNARTALDYLLVRLHALVTGEKPIFVKKVQFPIYDKPDRFQGAVAELRKQPAFSGYLARIEELQPYNLNNPSVWGMQPRQPHALYRVPIMHPLPAALDQLSQLDNIDKHRVAHAAWLGLRSPANMVDPEFVPDDFRTKESHIYTGPLESGAEVGYMRFRTPLSHSWEPDEMDMKRQFAIQISIFDERRFSGRVLEVLPACLWAVESVLTLFAPVFSGEPPLPVTAIPVP